MLRFTAILAAASSCLALTVQRLDAPLVHEHVARQASSGPLVTIQNGTYQGLYVSQCNQDFFLGVPYAQPPVGELRLRNPVSLNTSFTGVKQATSYSYDCINYGVRAISPFRA